MKLSASWIDRPSLGCTSMGQQIAWHAPEATAPCQSAILQTMQQTCKDGVCILRCSQKLHIQANGMVVLHMSRGMHSCVYALH